MQILWNGQTQHYVLFFHCDTPNFAYPAVGIARARNITGPYTWVRVAAVDRMKMRCGAMHFDDLRMLQPFPHSGTLQAAPAAGAGAQCHDLLGGCQAATRDPQVMRTSLA